MEITKCCRLIGLSRSTFPVLVLILSIGCSQPAPEQSVEEAESSSPPVAESEQKPPSITMRNSLGEEATLTLKTLPDSRGYQYCEMVFVYGDAGSDIYTTSHLAPCDVDWWDSLDLNAVAEERGAEKAIKNGPQWWSMDEVAQMEAEPVKVAGVDMAFGAHLPPGTMSTPHYQVFNPAKYQNLTWEAGKPSYQLVDPEGHVYVIQGHKIPVDELATLRDRMEGLPEGWEYRVVELEEDLVMNLTPAEAIPSVQDEFDQIYIRIPE